MPSRKLDIAIVQAGELTEDLAANLARLTELITAAAEPSDGQPGPDLVVLPELITTPYFCTSHDADRTNWAQTIPGPATEAFADLARRYRCGIAFGIYEDAGAGVAHNSVVVIDGEGRILPWDSPKGGQVPAYRKLSLPANKVSGIDIDEKYHFAPGQSPVTADGWGTRFGAVVCYDRSFPEYWATARGLGAEVMLAIVSSLGSREELFLAELQTRALESQMWIIAANRAGPETLNGVTVDYFGRSCVIAPDGSIVARAPAHRAGALVRATIDVDAVAAVRAAFPLRRDRRTDVMDLLARLTAGTAVPAPLAGQRSAPSEPAAPPRGTPVQEAEARR